MLAHIRSNLWLLVLTLLLCSILYPLALLGVGHALFPGNAEGSLIFGPDGKAIGSHLIAQGFTGDQYFQPRPSAASYNPAAAGATNWGASNYSLRERVARQLGPIVKYRGGAKVGELVGPDIEAWFQKDRYQGKPEIVAQWANLHPGSATSWVKADKLNTEYVEAWQKSHSAEVAAWVKENPGTPEPKPEDLVAPFFASYAKEHPGTFPGVVETKTPDGKVEKTIQPLREGSDIQGIFFEMWRQEHPRTDLEPVPADMVMASGSGLDPHITLKNALYQLPRVAAAWAATAKREPAALRKEIDELLRQKAGAPLGGLAGVDMINVLEINLALRDRYSAQNKATN